MDLTINKVYGDRLRVRICGLCWEGGRLLMVNHKGLADGDFWAPPGGGLQFGESVEDRLLKEFQEETGLRISVEKFLFGCEFIKEPLHAIELFFQVMVSGGKLKKGNDPEFNIIGDVRFMSPSELNVIPGPNLHGIFRLVRSPEDLKTLNGFFRI